MTPKTFLLAIAVAISLTSCFKEETFEPQEWKPEFTMPLIKSDFNLEDLVNVQNLDFSKTITSEEINPMWQGEVQSVPPVSGLSTENTPKRLLISKYFNKVYTSKLDLEIKFTNNFPITYGKGTKLMFKNEDDQAIIIAHELERDVNPGEVYSFPVELRQDGGQVPVVETNLLFYLEDFRSTGSSEPVNFDGAVNTFNIKLDFLRIVRIESDLNQDYKDTTSFSFTVFADSTDNDDRDIADGDLIFYVINTLPINVKLNGELLDENDQVLTTLFNEPLTLNAAVVDQNTGEITQSHESSNVLNLDYEKRQKLINGGKMRLHFDVNTIGVQGTGDYVWFTRKSFIYLQIVGDLEVKMNEI